MKKSLLKHVFYMTKLFTIAFTLQCLSMGLLLAWNGNAQVKNIEEVPVNLSLNEVKVEKPFEELETDTDLENRMPVTEIVDITITGTVTDENG